MPDTDGATDVIPVVALEVLSPGIEFKDRMAVLFYLAQGVIDVVLVDPHTGEVVHATPQGQTTHAAPVELALACGCAVTIPQRM